MPCPSPGAPATVDPLSSSDSSSSGSQLAGKPGRWHARHCPVPRRSARPTDLVWTYLADGDDESDDDDDKRRRRAPPLNHPPLPPFQLPRAASPLPSLAPTAAASAHHPPGPSSCLHAPGRRRPGLPAPAITRPLARPPTRPLSTPLQDAPHPTHAHATRTSHYCTVLAPLSSASSTLALQSRAIPHASYRYPPPLTRIRTPKRTYGRSVARSLAPAPAAPSRLAACDPSRDRREASSRRGARLLELLPNLAHPAAPAPPPSTPGRRPALQSTVPGTHGSLSASWVTVSSIPEPQGASPAPSPRPAASSSDAARRSAIPSWPGSLFRFGGP
ncbi:hypothetical protein CDD83_9990 [Cordyceps sp. RAO-2017]|nr:hypothetical protein CDD83_9990 [Cordyceps sp. RAO-2017]